MFRSCLQGLMLSRLQWALQPFSAEIGVQHSACWPLLWGLAAHAPCTERQAGSSSHSDHLLLDMMEAALSPLFVWLHNSPQPSNFSTLSSLPRARVVTKLPAQKWAGMRRAGIYIKFPVQQQVAVWVQGIALEFQHSSGEHRSPLQLPSTTTHCSRQGRGSYLGSGQPKQISSGGYVPVSVWSSGPIAL